MKRSLYLILFYILLHGAQAQRSSIDSQTGLYSRCAGVEDGVSRQTWDRRVPDSDIVIQLIDSGRCQSQKRVGPWITRNNLTGALYRSTMFGDTVDYWDNMYSPNGVISVSDSVKNGGTWRKTQSYFENGNLLNFTLIQDSTETWIGYHANGKVSATRERSFPLKFDEIYTVFRFYNNGTKRQEIQYQNNVKHGLVRRFRRSGVLEFECYYQNGKLDGLYKNYNENGELVNVSWYLDGVIH